ncbi:MAG: hypothetical protein AAB780_01535 [Patescibacteria group bacterium]
MTYFSNFAGIRSVRGSFSEGFRIGKAAAPVRTGIDDVLAYALWLVRHENEEAADAFIEKWCLEHPTIIH